jgi:hypothetical protein
LGFNESILGTGFWFLGEWVHSPVDTRKDESDRFDNMIDVLSKTFLGITVACARCHDHKFDAISTADYYALSGFLQSSDYREVRFESIEHNRRIADELAELDASYRQQIEELLEALFRENPTSEQLEELPAWKPGLSNIAVDYADIAADAFIQDGFLFGTSPRPAGEVFLDDVDGRPSLQYAKRTAAVSDPFWHGLKSLHEKGVHSRNRLGDLPRSGRTLRTPSFTLRHGDVRCRVRGSGHVVACVDSHRLIAGPLHGETIQKIKPGENWTRLNLERYVGHRLHLEFTPDDEGQLAVSFVVQGASSSELEALQQCERELEDAVDRRVRAIDARLSENAEVSRRIGEMVQSWAQRREELKSRVRLESRLAMAMLDGSGEDDHILIRGNASNVGPVVPRRFLTAISSGEPLAVPSGSGRLELAREVNDPANPLTSRVIVNRIWHHLMGSGLVPTTDDFGELGQRPSHPELLDHLASRFVAEGRSIKRMIRYIVLSRTYQQSSQSESTAVAADPKNTWWHHRPPKRLEGEVIRDALLSISGQMDTTMFGEPVPIHLTPFMEGRGRPPTSGPLDGRGRRSIYIAVRRNFLSPFMLAFDTPVPFSTMGRRNVSNVPAQALILMNDPFVVQQTRKWAERALQQIPPRADESGAKERIVWMYTEAFARHPTERELQSATRFLSQQSAARDVKLSDVDLWADFAHALVNTKEFVFLR